MSFKSTFNDTKDRQEGAAREDKGEIERKKREIIHEHHDCP